MENSNESGNMESDRMVPERKIRNVYPLGTVDVYKRQDTWLGLHGIGACQNAADL